MQAAELLIFFETRPFDPFRLFLSDGRQIDVKHPEMAQSGQFAASVWVFHAGGELEVVDRELIISLKTLGQVDPLDFMGSANQPENPDQQ